MKANTKNWNKVTVKDITAYLNSNTKEIAERAKTDKKALRVFNAQKKLVDTLKEGKKVFKAEYVALAEKVEKLLATPVAAEEKPKAQQKKEATPKQESSLKAKGKTTKKSEPEEKAEEAKPTPKQEKKKASDEISMDEAFPKKLVTDDGASYTRRDDIDSFDKLRKLLEDDVDVYTLRYITPEEKAQYANGQVKPLKNFPNNTDLNVVLYIGERTKMFITVSVYTEACYVMHGGEKGIKGLKKYGGLRNSGKSFWTFYVADEA